MKILENKLIPIYQKDNQTYAVNTRDLHAGLEVKTRYNDWIRDRIKKLDLTETTDFQALTENLVSGGKQTSYIVSLDTAKEIALMENNEKGKQFRKYFIEVEKEYQKLVNPQTDFDALVKGVLAANRIVEKQKEEIAYMKQDIKMLEPAKQFYNTIADVKNNITIRETALILDMPNVGQNLLFKMLRNRSILINAPDTRKHNTPYQTFIDRGYFVVIEKIVGNMMRNVTLVTPKGLKWLHKILLSPAPTAYHLDATSLSKQCDRILDKQQVSTDELVKDANSGQFTGGYTSNVDINDVLNFGVDY